MDPAQSGPVTADPALPTLPDESVGRLLAGMWQLTRQLKGLVGPVLTEQFGLDLPRYLILRAIQQGTVYPKLLSVQLGIIPTQLSRSLDGLSTQGHLTRQLDPADSRRTRLSLTPQGLDLCTQASHAIRHTIAGRLTALDPERLNALLTAIELLASSEVLEHP